MHWEYEELEQCESTFLPARRHPAWWVVSAVRQTQGRGRFNRTWFGEPGGLWATYNVPIDPALPRPWGLLPLVAGVAIMRALSPLGIAGLRLRWPNDVLVARSKLAGILVERPAERVAAIGIGINVRNDIQSLAPLVQDPPARLADLTTACPTVPELRSSLAAAIAESHTAFMQSGFSAISGALATAWQGERPVEVITDSGSHRGIFTGIAEDGSPILRPPTGPPLTIPALQVNRLIEL